MSRDTSHGVSRSLQQVTITGNRELTVFDLKGVIVLDGGDDALRVGFPAPSGALGAELIVKSATDQAHILSGNTGVTPTFAELATTGSGNTVAMANNADTSLKIICDGARFNVLPLSGTNVYGDDQ